MCVNSEAKLGVGEKGMCSFNIKRIYETFSLFWQQFLGALMKFSLKRICSFVRLLPGRRGWQAVRASEWVPAWLACFPFAVSIVS